MVVEHTLHIVVLPGLHWHAQQAPSNASDTGSAVVPRSDSTVSLREHASTPTSSARLRYPEHSFWPPSPFHLVLPIITRLSFNEAGKITHHRDFWDVKVSSRSQDRNAARNGNIDVNRVSTQFIGPAGSSTWHDARPMGHWPACGAGNPERR